MSSVSAQPWFASPRLQAWLGSLGLVGLGLLLYGSSLSSPLVFDDWLAVTENPTLGNLADLQRVLLPPANGSGVAGRPMVNLSLALDHAYSDGRAVAFRLTNLVGHVVCALVLAALVRRLYPRLTPWGGWGLAAAWLLHPLQTESVMSVVQRTEILFSLALLGVLYALVRAWNSSRPRTWEGLGVLACGVGMTCKEVMVVAPILALLMDRAFGAGSFLAAWRLRRGFYLGLAGTWLILGFLVWHMGGQRGDAAGFGAGGVASWHYLLTQADAIPRYLGLVAWPHPLVLDYGMSLVTDLSVVWIRGGVLIGALGVTLLGLVRNRRWAFAAAACFLILAPSSSFMPLPAQTVAEHRMYLPLAFVLLLALVEGGGPWIRLRRVAPFLLAGWLAVAWVRTRDYRTEYGLWVDTVQKVPANARAWTNLGVACAKLGRDAEAEGYFRRALTLQPESTPARLSLAKCLLGMGRMAEAEGTLRQAVARDPAAVEGWGMLGLVLAQTGRGDEAMVSVRHAVELAPLDAGASFFFGSVLMLKRDFIGALEPLRLAVKLHPGHLAARNNLAAALLHLGRGAEAEEHLRFVLRVQPGNAEAQRNLDYWLRQSPAAAPR